MIEVDWYYVLALEVEDPVLIVIAMETLHEIESFTRATLDIQCSLEPIGELSCCVYNRDQYYQEPISEKNLFFMGSWYYVL